jgi:hypothetical protein
VPVVAHNPGKEETFWSSTVSMANLGTETAVIHLEYLPENTDSSVAVDADCAFFAYLVVVDGSSQDPAFMLPLP